MTPTGSLLITGGAGYVGSHIVLAFRDAGYRVVVLDDLSTGRRSAVPREVPFIEGDAGNPGTVGAIIAEHGVTAVVHLAGSIAVPESIVDPLKYYRNNTLVSATLLEACIAGGVGRFVFASSAGVYGGVPSAAAVSEEAPAAPAHPYGRSKLMTERMLHDTAAAHDFRYAALRYGNVAGADPQGRAGPSGRGAAHLVKVACEAAAGARDAVTVFGTDYDTPDGTCVRDYIHVSDLADIHLAILRALESGAPSRVLNCGYGRGHSVRSVLDAVRREAGVDFDIRDGPRRPGDPPVLICDPSRLRASVDWAPRYDDLGLIVRSAMAWEKTSGAAPPARIRARSNRAPPAGSGPAVASHRHDRNASPGRRAARGDAPGTRFLHGGCPLGSPASLAPSRPPGDPEMPCRGRYKRLFDLTFTLLVLVILLPVWPLLVVAIAFAIRIESPGPVIYRQSRLGRGGRVFRMLKFRTMIENAEARSGPVLAARRDPRITAVGRVLRRFHLDEMPQAVNVLRGDMSLVGPRPERPELVGRIEREVPGYSQRLRVRPGIAGLAQARGAYHLHPRQKLRYDLLYIAAMSPCLDLDLCMRCLWRAVRPAPARGPAPMTPEARNTVRRPAQSARR